MAEYTRVRDKRTGHHISVPRVNSEFHEVLEGHDATDRNGQPLPPKYHTEVTSEAKTSRKKTGESA